MFLLDAVQLYDLSMSRAVDHTDQCQLRVKVDCFSLATCHRCVIHSRLVTQRKLSVKVMNGETKDPHRDPAGSICSQFRHVKGGSVIYVLNYFFFH